MQIFMNYANPDQDFAIELASRLNETGHKVWIDTWELYPGENWQKAIGEALENSQAMVVVVSPRAVESRELQSALGFAVSSMNYKGRVIPVEVESTDEIPAVLSVLGPIAAHGDVALACREIVQRLAAVAEGSHR